MINVIFREGISDENYQDLLKTVLPPENCSSLTRTKVNQLIWNWLSPYTKSYDVSIQQHQNVITKASINVVKMLDKLDKMKINKESSDYDIQECIDLGLGSIGLMAQYNRITNLKRKEVHRPDLEQDYHHLCSPNVAFTDILYGDLKNVKEIQDVKHVGKKIGKFPASGYYRGRSSTRDRGGRGIRARGRGGPGPRGRHSGRGFVLHNQVKKLQCFSVEKVCQTSNFSTNTSKKFHAGILKNYSNNWKKLTSDKNILDIVLNCHIEFIDNPPVQNGTPYQRMFDKNQVNILEKSSKYFRKRNK